MTRLLTIKRRIKTAETIKKTTNALRLVAMSSHGNLRKTQEALDFYTAEVNRLFTDIGAARNRLLAAADESAREYAFEEKAATADNRKIVCVVIGSQKGSCGNFNTSLASYAEDRLRTLDRPYDLTVVGKKMRDTLLHQGLEPLISYDEFNARNATTVAADLTRVTLSAVYREALFFYTFPTGFFVRTHREELFSHKQFYMPPEEPEPVQAHNGDESNSVLYEQPYRETFNALGFLALKASIENILARSLLAEASSRFLSMDSATHNAENMIEALRLDYNKLRQANITRELTDLSAGFMQ